MLEKLNYAQKERLAYIDFCLEYFGQISRVELIEKFQTGLASCSRDLATYKDLAPENAILTHETKKYLRSVNFSPVFEHDPETILTALARGFGNGISNANARSEICFDAIRLVHPKPSVISAIMRAIHLKVPFKCSYESISSGSSARILVPHAVINNGHRWHVRAFDRKSISFRDFVCTRFTEIELLEESATEAEGQSKDDDWNKVISLEIIPHESLKFSKAVELDYGMSEGKLMVETRSALAGYLLRQWNVDCSPCGNLTGGEYQLKLANVEALAGCSSSALAPGFINSNKGN